MSDQGLTSAGFEVARHQNGELVARLTDLFVKNTDAFSSNAQEIFGDIVLSVLQKIDGETRQELSGKLARCSATPIALAEQLAQDPQIRIARPMLSCSERLSDQFLKTIASERGEEFLAALASRPSLSAGLSSTIAKRGGADVHLTLVRNPNASLTAETYAKILSLPFDAVMQRALSFRPDIPADLLPKIAARLPVRERDRLQKYTRLSDRTGSMASDQRRYNGSRVSDDVTKLLKPDRSNIDDAIVSLATKGRPMDVCRLIAHAAAQPEQQVQEIFFRADVSPLIDVCRAVNIGNRGFEAVAEIRAARRRLGSAQVKAELAAFFAALTG